PNICAESRRTPTRDAPSRSALLRWSETEKRAIARERVLRVDEVVRFVVGEVLRTAERAGRHVGQECDRRAGEDPDGRAAGEVVRPEVEPVGLRRIRDRVTRTDLAEDADEDPLREVPRDGQWRTRATGAADVAAEERLVRLRVDREALWVAKDGDDILAYKDILGRIEHEDRVLVRAGHVHEPIGAVVLRLLEGRT